jgi:raffinose/stachyose/melibiose transport system permease protein
MSRLHKHWKGIALFLAPTLLLYFAFFVFPLGFLFVTSFTDWTGVRIGGFVGLQNFQDLFENPTFRLSIRNNIIWALSLGVGQITLAAIVAMILARQPRGWKTFRTVYFLPNVISQVAIAMMWAMIYNAEYGALNRLLEIVGLGHLGRNWLGSVETALPAVIFQQVFYIGYFMIILLAATMSIPRSLYEAAEIDGASILQQEFFITIPMNRQIMVTCMTLAMAFGLRHFEATFLLTGGGPANRTSVMGIMLYNNLHFLRYGRANAIGAVLVLIGIVVIVGLRSTLGRKDDQQEARQ